MRTAIYTGTRNLYEYMIGAAKSLLSHSNVEQIYFLIEDDKFPYELPPKTTTINVAGQDYFKKDGPNYNSEFTYMALIRIALAKILPNIDMVLSLDVDTIVNENISDLWDLDISNYYFAAAKQPTKCTDTYLDINAGVMLINLKKLREDKKDDEIIDYINTTYEVFPEQNAIGKLCQGYILEIAPDYNYNDSTDYKNAISKKISHFAGVHEWQKYPIFKKYMNIPNNKIIYNQPDKDGLDIIIPSYNDKKGLIRTLDTVYYPELQWLHIIIIDDASSVEYEDILEKYPLIKLIKLDENKGPGNARRIGMKNSDSPYLMFVDCGDIILSKYCLLAIKNEINTHRTLDIYEWSWINDEDSTVSGAFEPSTPGKVYRRGFLEAYDIYPYNVGAGSYAAEDCGLNFSCYAIIHDYADVEETEHIKHYPLPVYRTIINKDSLTFKDNKEFWYTAVAGIVDNAIYCIDLCEKAQVHIPIILEQMNNYMIDLYTYFLRCVKYRPWLVDNHWKDIRRYYFQSYKKYMSYPDNETYQTFYFTRRIKGLKNYFDHPNFKLFIRELETNEFCPIKYLT